MAEDNDETVHGEISLDTDDIHILIYVLSAVRNSEKGREVLGCTEEQFKNFMVNSERTFESLSFIHSMICPTAEIHPPDDKTKLS